MGALTDEVPKPLLEVEGKTLLEHKFDVLPDIITEIVLVVGYHGPKIRERLGDTYGTRPITYVTQETLNGTGGALWEAEGILRERFVIMMGDDLYAREDIEQCIATPGWSILVSATDHMQSGGRMVDRDGAIVAIEEGEHQGPGLMNTNLFVLDPSLFGHHLVPKSAGSPEYGLPQTVLAASLATGRALSAVYATTWIQVTSPEDLERAARELPALFPRA